jgi:protein gp37
MGQEKYAGLTVLNKAGDRHFNGTVKTHEAVLEIPLKRRKPTMYFVNSMSDLFHGLVPFEFIDKVFAVMALCPQHTFQVLTKRPERMAEYLADRKYEVHNAMSRMCSTLDDGTVPAKLDPLNGRKFIVPRHLWAQAHAFPEGQPWPLPNVWLGTSTENQATADERIPHLLKCPAAVRFISAEPLIGPVDFDITNSFGCGDDDHRGHGDGACDGVHWVIVGGESGKGARPCNVAWVRSIVEQCQAAGVAVFCKQFGKRPCCQHSVVGGSYSANCAECFPQPIRDPKGGDMAEWPEDLRVREFPR